MTWISAAPVISVEAEGRLVGRDRGEPPDAGAGRTALDAVRSERSVLRARFQLAVVPLHLAQVDPGPDHRGEGHSLPRQEACRASNIPQASPKKSPPPGRGRSRSRTAAPADRERPSRLGLRGPVPVGRPSPRSEAPPLRRRGRGPGPDLGAPPSSASPSTEGGSSRAMDAGAYWSQGTPRTTAARRGRRRRRSRRGRRASPPRPRPARALSAPPGS